jgi:transcriptional regulator with XRE-family HTH domain
LARRIGVVKQTVQRYEEGRIAISADAVRICAEVLGITIADFYGAEIAPSSTRPDRIALMVAAEIMALPNDDIRKKLFVLAKAINNGWNERDAA